jgi:hypothetical protein
MAADETRARDKGEVIYRHSRAVRLTHWINAVVLLVMLMSGLQIFNAHPAPAASGKIWATIETAAFGPARKGTRAAAAGPFLDSISRFDQPVG